MKQYEFIMNIENNDKIIIFKCKICVYTYIFIYTYFLNI